MKKTIRLTESDLMKLVKRIINERMSPPEEDLIDATYDLMYDLYDSEYVDDLYIEDLHEAAEMLEEELYKGNHGSDMDKKIEDLLFKIEDIVGYSDDEGEDIEDHL
jgi:hypothetical protein